MITAEIAREMFEYDPDAGTLVRRHRMGNRCAGSLVDSVDKDGYVVISIGHRSIRRRYFAHRIIWLIVYGQWPVNDIDHKNRVRNDNRISNLREATRLQNMANRLAMRRSKTGIKGVSLHSASGLYRACMGINRKHYNFGYFKTPEEAAAVIDKKFKEIYGEYAA